MTGLASTAPWFLNCKSLLGIGAWNFSGAWCLELGAFLCPVAPTKNVATPYFFNCGGAGKKVFKFRPSGCEETAETV